MFSKLRRTAAVLSEPGEKIEFPGISPIPDYDEIRKERYRRAGFDEPRPFNPVIRLIEMVLVGLVASFGILPLMHLVTASQGKVSSVLTGVSTVMLFAAWEHVGTSITGRIGRLIRLDFLDPYVGNRVKRTIRLLKGQTDDTQTAS